MMGSVATTTFSTPGIADNIINEMRLVLDTDVVLSGLRSTIGASRVLLRAVEARVVTPLVSVATVIEYEAVLKRPENLRATGLAPDDVDRFLDALIARASHVTTWFQQRPSIRDPDDELFVELAVNGRAEAIVTFNRRDFTATDLPFDHLGIAVLSPGEALRRLAWRP
jgi:putative PIN family toxin of toxin-antitoxin system